MLKKCDYLVFFLCSKAGVQSRNMKMALGLVMNTDKKFSCLANNNVKIIPNVEDFNIIIIKATK